MKYLFLVNDASFLFEFAGQVAHQLAKEPDTCLIVVNSKMAEYEKMRFFPGQAKMISKVDWCMKQYDGSKKEFGELSWRELYTVYERFNLQAYDYQKCVGMVNQLYQFFEHIFEKEKPSVVIGEPPAGLFGLVAQYFCQKNNIPFCGIAESRIPGRIDLYDKEWTDSTFEKNFQNLKKEDLLPQEIAFAGDFIKKFISHETIYASYYLVKMRFGPLDFITHYIKRLKESGNILMRYFLQRSDFKDFDYESESIMRRSLSAPFRVVVRNVKILLQKNIFDKTNPKDSYFFFPLQYEPEASTLVLATYYSNQLATVKNTAIALPFGYKLYLKEHPGSIGARKNSFYKEIKKIPNAVLLSSEESTPDIIKGSAGVITMTSTVGMEAAMAGKPVYVLGNVFYSYHPLCEKVVNFSDLEEKIRKGLGAKMETPDLEVINLRFIISYLRGTIPADILEAADGQSGQAGLARVSSQKEDKNNYELICSKVKSRVLNI